MLIYEYGIAGVPFPVVLNLSLVCKVNFGGRRSLGWSGGFAGGPKTSPLPANLPALTEEAAAAADTPSRQQQQHLFS